MSTTGEINKGDLALYDAVTETIEARTPAFDNMTGVELKRLEGRREPDTLLAGE